MIDLTPLEVRQKKGDFRRAMRGYDAELVNDFLDLVADRMEELVRENMTLRDSATKLEAELVAYREKERNLSEALMAAQRLRDDAKSHAEKEGELMIREARLAAETAREEAIRALAREEDALRQARARRAQLVDSFRRMLERELNELAVLERSLELQKGTGKAAAPRRQAPSGGKAGGDAAAPKKKPAAEAPQQPRGEAEEKPAGGGGPSEEKAAGPSAEGEAPVQEDWLSSLVEE